LTVVSQVLEDYTLGLVCHHRKFSSVSSSISALAGRIRVANGTTTGGKKSRNLCLRVINMKSKWHGREGPYLCYVQICRCTGWSHLDTTKKPCCGCETRGRESAVMLSERFLGHAHSEHLGMANVFWQHRIAGTISPHSPVSKFIAVAVVNAKKKQGLFLDGDPCV
jgi:hypothetical protein